MLNSQGDYQQQAFQPPLQPKVNLEDAITQLSINISQFMAKTNTTLKSYEITLQSQVASLKNLKV